MQKQGKLACKKHVFGLGDVGLIISKADVGKNSVPSKTWNIMSAARTVLASFDLDSDLNSIITEADCGICVPAGDIDALESAILGLYNAHPDLISRQGRNGREFVLEHLTRAKGTEKYRKVIEEVVNRSKS